MHKRTTTTLAALAALAMSAGSMMPAAASHRNNHFTEFDVKINSSNYPSLSRGQAARLISDECPSYSNPGKAQRALDNPYPTDSTGEEVVWQFACEGQLFTITAR